MKQKEEVDAVMPNDSEHLRVHDYFPEKHATFSLKISKGRGKSGAGRLVVGTS